MGSLNNASSGRCSCEGTGSGCDGKGVNRHTITAIPRRTSSPVMMNNGLRMSLSAERGLLYRVVLSQSLGVTNAGTTHEVDAREQLL